MLAMHAHAYAVPTSSPPFQGRASATIATMPTALTTNMPKNAFWP
jgi:hypothetical protein